jgi:hypothetical protein
LHILVVGIATLSTRNKIAAALALVSAFLFIASGYRANVGIYRAIESGIQHYTTKEVWQVAIISIDILTLIAQLGGFAVLAGAFLFLKNHITTGKSSWWWLERDTGYYHNNRNPDLGLDKQGRRRRRRCCLC